MPKKKSASNACRKIKRLFFESGLQQKEYAREIGLSHSSLMAIINEINSPSAKVLCNIANHHSVSLDWLCSEGGLDGARNG